MSLYPIDPLRVYPIFPLGDFPPHTREEHQPKEEDTLLNELTPFEVVLKRLINES